MDNLSLVTKIQLNLDSENKYLEIKNGKFLIYDNKQILSFSKNLSYKKLFLSKNENEIYINFIKKINNGKFLCLNNNKIYIFTIKSEIIINNIIKLEENQKILDAIELKNGVIIVSTNNQILSVKINDNKFEINKLLKNPDEFLLKNDNIKNINLEFNIYNLPNNNNTILIHSFSCGYETVSLGCLEGYYYYIKEKIFSFNIDKCIITNYIKNLEYNILDTFNKLKIMINNKYICILKNMNKLFIYNISNYEFIKEIEINEMEKYYLCYHFDENIILFHGRYFLSLYDITDINKIENKKIFIYNVVPRSTFQYYNGSELVKKISDRKFMAKGKNYIFIIKY